MSARTPATPGVMRAPASDWGASGPPNPRRCRTSSPGGGEYLYTDLGSETKTSSYLPGSTFLSPAYSEAISNDLTFNTVRLGVNYKF